MEARFLNSGDTALVVEFGTKIDLHINTEVSKFHTLLKKHPIDGVEEVLPTYRSLTLFYHPEIIGYRKLVKQCQNLLEEMEQVGTGDEVLVSRVVHMPVLFGGKVGDELEDVAAYHNMTPQELIDTVTSHQSRVYMIGFMPGLAYMSAENGLHMPRHTTPRLNNGLTGEDGGVFVLADNQTNIMDFPSPTGWHPVGHTPFKQFVIDREEPFLFQPGDWCQFEAVTEEEFEEILRAVKAGSYQVKISYKEMV